MTRIILLEKLGEFTKEATKDLLLPYKRKAKVVTNEQTGKQETLYEGPEMRSTSVYLTRLPDDKIENLAPCILHQVVTGKDFQEPGYLPQSTAVVRSCFCVYGNNEAESGLNLLNLMERLRIALLESHILAGQYKLDLQTGLETLVYPDSDKTAPYALGEMVSNWWLPPVKRKVVVER